jgi:TonB-dependent SusC/RagA subfamily outer membrane receptor
MKNLLWLLLLASGPMEGYALEQLVKGKITDVTNRPLTGATVTLKGTTVTTSTDESGNFQIKPGNQVKPVLVVSFVGYLNQEYPVKGRSNLTIQLQQDICNLGDVIVVGYGVQRKRDVTGAASTIKADEIAKRPLVKVEQALQGTTSGVVVQQNSGQPGQSISVRIREPNSISGSNEPLYVIDGFIGGNIESLNMGDIESLEILKDASATAMYGSRGSNAVVLITTKSGKEGKARVDFNPWFSMAEIPKELKLMNAYDFANTTNAQFDIRGQAPGFQIR